MRELVIVRGGGDLATGTIHKLVRCGYDVLILEIERPSAIRRNVSFCEAVYEQKVWVEGMCCQKADTLKEALSIMESSHLSLLVDPKAECLDGLEQLGRKPAALVDAIIAKRNMGTTIDMAPITIGLGPGFAAGEDVDYVIETQRGHNLGRIITKGSAMANTGIPGTIRGYGKERVIHAPAAGLFYGNAKIGDVVQPGLKIGHILQAEQQLECVEQEHTQISVEATIHGILRGIIRDGYNVKEGFKIADIDPRVEELENYNSISDKARCIAGGVLEAILAGKRLEK